MKQQYVQPTTATENDSTAVLNVVSTTEGGAVQVVTTNSQIVTHEADRHVIVGDVLIGPGHNKSVPTDLYVDGSITIEKTGDKTIGDETVKNEGILYVNGNITCTDTIDIDGDLVFEDGPVDSQNFGIKNGSADFTGWTLVGEGPYHTLYQKQITFTVPFTDSAYTVTLQTVNYPNPAGGSGSSHPGYLFPINKTANGFKIYVHTIPADLEYIDWVAIKY